MKSSRRLLPWALLLAGSLDAPSVAAETATLYGQKLQGLPPVRLEEILAKPEAGKMVRVEGTIEKVCQNRGCWLELKQGTKSVHVTFAGYSFFVPKDSATKHVVLEGRVVVKEPERSEVAHKEAEGAGPAAGARVSLEASGVLIAP